MCNNIPLTFITKRFMRFMFSFMCFMRIQTVMKENQHLKDAMELKGMTMTINWEDVFLGASFQYIHDYGRAFSVVCEIPNAVVLEFCKNLVNSQEKTDPWESKFYKADKVPHFIDLAVKNDSADLFHNKYAVVVTKDFNSACVIYRHDSKFYLCRIESKDCKIF